MTTAVTRRAATGQEPAASAHQTVEDLLQRVEHRLQSFLAAERGRYAEVHSHAVVAIDALSDLVTAGGKLIRPAYCLTGYLAAGGEADAPASSTRPRPWNCCTSPPSSTTTSSTTPAPGAAGPPSTSCTPRCTAHAAGRASPAGSARASPSSSATSRWSTPTS